MRAVPPLAVLLFAVLALPNPSNAQEDVDIAVNTARVWLTPIEDMAAVAMESAATDGMPPDALNFTITRDHRYLLSVLWISYRDFIRIGQLSDIDKSSRMGRRIMLFRGQQPYCSGPCMLCFIHILAACSWRGT